MGIPRDAILKKRPEVSARELGEGGVLVNMQSGECFELNRVGFQIWNELDGARDVAQLHNLLGAAYPIDERQLMADVDAMLESLLRAGLLERCNTR